MPTKDRTMGLYRQLLEAALDQPRPTPELKAAAAAVMKAIEHSLAIDERRAAVMPDYQERLQEWLS